MIKWIKNIVSKIDRKLIVDITVIIIPILLIILFLNLKPSNVDVTLNNKRIEEKIDSVRLSNEALTNEINELEKNQITLNDIITQNNVLIEQNNKELTKLKRLYNDKINSVSGYNVAQLDSFFSNRYKEKYNR
jgi:cell division protein FtsL